MSGNIKRMADELREHIRRDSGDGQGTKTKNKVRMIAAPELDSVLEAMAGHELGTEVINVRLDVKVTRLLRQLKIVRGIDMNKFIAFTVQDFLKHHPTLITYIKDSLNDLDL